MGRGKKRKSRHKSSGGRSVPLSLPEWYASGLSDWPTEDILAKLKEHGLAMDEATFRADAENCPDPSELAEQWRKRVSKNPGRWEDFFELAARRLWERILPERDTFSSLVEDISAHLDDLDDRGESKWSPSDVDQTMHFLDRLETLLKRVEQSEGGDLKERLNMIGERHSYDFGFWLVQLPMDLSGQGYVDQAVEVIRRFVFVDPGNMLGDLGWILASHGRCAEALTQAEQNLKQLSDDPWVIIKAGDVYDQCGQPEKAVELYKHALEMDEDQYTRDGAWERLIPLCERLGKHEEAEGLTRMARQGRWADIDSRPSVNSARRVKTGRNDPCPCGSGKKYKKCCLNESE